MTGHGRNGAVMKTCPWKPVTDDMAPPKGKIESIVTSLEMRERPTSPTPPMPAERIAILRAESPTTAFYRFLYNTIGGPWRWWERRVMDDDTLSKIVSDPGLEIYVLYVRGVPAGMCELDCRNRKNVELAYFGLIPEFVGRGLGGYLLRWGVDQAWSHDPERVWVHTCTEDHAAALPMYQKIGFQPYEQKTEIIDDPEHLFVNEPSGMRVMKNRP